MFWIGEYFALVNSKDFEPDDVEFARLKFEALVAAYEAHKVFLGGWYFHQEDQRFCLLNQKHQKLTKLSSSTAGLRETSVLDTECRLVSFIRHH